MILELYKTDRGGGGGGSSATITTTTTTNGVVSQMTKMDIEKDSFRPQEFRSSRSNRQSNPSGTSQSSSSSQPNRINEHEKAMFGAVNSSMFNPIQPSMTTSSSAAIAEKSLLNPSVRLDFGKK